MAATPSPCIVSLRRPEKEPVSSLRWSNIHTYVKCFRDTLWIGLLGLFVFTSLTFSVAQLVFWRGPALSCGHHAYHISGSLRRCLLTVPKENQEKPSTDACTFIQKHSPPRSSQLLQVVVRESPQCYRGGALLLEVRDGVQGIEQHRCHQQLK